MSMGLQGYFESIAMLAWSLLALISILVIISNASSITTTNLLLILILGTLAYPMFIENANDVTADVIDAAMTLISYLSMKKGE